VWQNREGDLGNGMGVRYMATGFCFIGIIFGLNILCFGVEMGTLFYHWLWYCWL
jgi:hypothetical protein